MNYNDLSLREKFGQMFLVGLDVDRLDDELISIIKDYKIGGVVIYKKNYSSLDSMLSFINKLKEINKDSKVPLFIGIDQENGRVNRFPQEIKTIYSPLKQAETKDLKIIDEVNSLTVSLLKKVGVNMNFAPVLDIYKYDLNTAIGNRSYGRNKEDVIKYGLPFALEMQKNKIVSVVKHFPGHGNTKKDSHVLIPRIKEIDEMEKNDMEVFKEAIKMGVDSIMVGHLSLKGFGFKPASINKKIINKYLNEEIFQGLIITDDLRMNFLKYLYGTNRSIIKAINAGNNMVMIKYQKNDSKKVFRRLFKKLDNNKLDVSKINNSARKILDIKEKYEVSDKILDNKFDVGEINKKIDKINKLIDNFIKN